MKNIKAFLGGILFFGMLVVLIAATNKTVYDQLRFQSLISRITGSLNFDSNTFVVDADNNRVGVGAAPAVPFQVSTTGSPIATLTSSYSSASEVVLDIQKTKTPGANGDSLGQIKFLGIDAGTQGEHYATITAKIVDNTNDGEDGSLALMTMKDHLYKGLTINSGIVDIDQSIRFPGGGNKELNTYNQADLDCPVSGATTTNLIGKMTRIGNVVTLRFNSHALINITGSYLYVDGCIPSGLRPSDLIEAGVGYDINGTVSINCVYMRADMNRIMFLDKNCAWVGSGNTMTFPSLNVSYLVD